MLTQKRQKMKQIYETQEQREKAIIAAFIKKGSNKDEALDSLEELGLLVDTAGGEVVEKVYQEMPTPNVSTLLGKGKVQELVELVKEHQATMVVFDNELSPVQVRNLSNALNVKVLDRSGIILDIFAKNAKTLEAQLQVELAQNLYLLPRLSRMWTHLSKQYGGIGTKGPGETQIETDRRIIRRRIQVLREKLKLIETQNYEQRKSRQGIPRFALVGYTNAGKSTLMNALTDAGVYVEDKLFATLSTIVRQITLPSGKTGLVSDTVGFIRNLPHHLVASFRSTLAEASESDVILIVVDISDNNFSKHIQTVVDTLNELNIKDKPMIYVFNKIDKLERLEHLKQIKDEYPTSVFVSAKRNMNIAELLIQMEKEYDKLSNKLMLFVPYDKNSVLNKIYKMCKVIDRKDTNEGTILTVNYQSDTERQVRNMFGEYELC